MDYAKIKEVLGRYGENKLALIIISAILGALLTGIVQNYYYTMQQGESVVIVTPDGRSSFSANPDQIITFSYIVVNKRNNPIYVSPSESGMTFTWNDWQIPSKISSTGQDMSVNEEGRKINSVPSAPLQPNNYLQYQYKFKAPSKEGTYTITMVASTDEGKVTKEVTLFVMSQLANR